MSRQGTLRTVVVGFDALSPRYLDTFELPNFDALRRRGTETTLEATFPPWTGTAWPSVYTGTGPSHHGVYSFFDFRRAYPGEAPLATRDDVEAPALWDYLAADGARSLVLNVPLTHPVGDGPGVLVPGYLAPEGTPGRPADVQEEISEAIGEPYRIYEENLPASVGDDLDRHCALVDLRRRAATYLLENHECEFAFLQVQKTDSVFHNFAERDAHRRVYEAADEFLGAVLATVGDEVNVVVCGDHGIGPVSGYKIYVNELLRREGFVETTSDGSAAVLKDSKSKIVRSGDVGSDDSEETGPTRGARALAAAGAVLESVGVSPGDVYAAAERLGVADALVSRLPGDTAEAVGEHVDWRRSVAYCRSPAELGVRINVTGRDPDGVVPPREYDRVRDRLLSFLRGLETPDGRPAFDWVKPREAVYDGPRTEHACDVLFRPREMNNVVASSLLGRAFVPVETYDHQFDGTFIAAGPAFDADASPGRLSLDDVAPTVMASLDRPVPARMTGAAPSGLLREDVRTADYGPVPYGTDGAETGEGQVERRLEDLGYL